MKRLLFQVGYILSIVATLVGCRSPGPKPQSSPESTASQARPVADLALTAEGVLSALKAANLPIENDVLYTAETDPNKLLGRPNQYVGKASWNDKRVDALTSGDRSMTFEIFTSLEDLENRRRYVEAVSKTMSPLAEYQYVHKNALLRLNHQLTPQQAVDYEKVLRGL